ncbi:MAG: DegV family EDD domain-containing protein [Clostridia bacterium]|nr:DegV family EDD domain-containing protein [Clostridia bacterium]
MTDTISSQMLHRAILHGAVRTREKKDDLNRINVFPVVDNDTGSNLAHTMQYILNHAKAHDDVRSTLKEIARSALIGARGNSGAIFSQYFNGLYQSSSEKAAVTLTELGTYFHEAYERAYKSLETPVEGTVLTLMRAWAVSFRESLETRQTLPELLQESMAKVKQSLEDTTHTLKRLQSLGIVDAGALGFYYFMEGFVQVMLGHDVVIEQAALIADLAEPAQDIHIFSAEADIPFRYCTEVLIESDSLNPDALRNELRPLGDCLLLSAADNLARIHLHTDQPWEMVKRAAAHGSILEQKADDMVWQNLLASPHEAKIACVTDSIADLPQEYIFQHQIFQIPIHIMIDGVSYLDKVTIDSDFLGEHIKSASTAQLNTAQIQAYLQPILQHYDNVLILTVSSQMSGTYGRFREALAELPADERSRLALIDTKVNSGAEGLLVREAVHLIESGMAFEPLVTAMENLRSRAKIVVSVLDIEPMARSGRVSERIGDLLIKLKFKPLITIDPEGKGTIKGVAFSEKRNWKNLLKSLRGKAIGDYVIVHADALDRAQALQTEMQRLTGRAPLYITKISSAVTLFAGRGSIAAAYIEKERA